MVFPGIPIIPVGTGWNWCVFLGQSPLSWPCGHVGKYVFTVFASRCAPVVTSFFVASLVKEV